MAASQLTVLVDDTGFRTGLAYGLGALAVVALIAVAPRAASRRDRGRHVVRRSPAPLSGPLAIAMVVAALLALDDAYPGTPTNRLIGGLAILVVGPLVADLILPNRLVSTIAGAAVAVVGALLVADAASTAASPRWLEAVMVVSIVVGGALTADFDRANLRSGLTPVLIAITVLGMYVTLPDTELVKVIVGVTLPLALLGLPVPLASVGAAAYGSVGLLVWTSAVQGVGREGSVIGSIACLGILGFEPIVRRVLRSRAGVARQPWTIMTAAMIAIQLGVVAITSRVAGLETSATRAAVIAVAAVVVGAVVLALVSLATTSRTSAARVSAGDPPPDLPRP